MNEKESARMTSDRSPVLQTLIQFYEYALSRRDVKRAAELLTEDVFFVGTAESIADRQNFERSFREKLRHIPNRTLYEISDYREKARGENTWDCSCKIHLILPDRKERYMAKLTAVVLRENGVYCFTQRLYPERGALSVPHSIGAEGKAGSDFEKGDLGHDLRCDAEWADRSLHGRGVSDLSGE